MIKLFGDHGIQRKDSNLQVSVAADTMLFQLKVRDRTMHVPVNEYPTQLVEALLYSMLHLGEAAFQLGDQSTHGYVYLGQGGSVTSFGIEKNIIELSHGEARKLTRLIVQFWSTHWDSTNVQFHTSILDVIVAIKKVEDDAEAYGITAKHMYDEFIQEAKTYALGKPQEAMNSLNEARAYIGKQ